MQGVAAHSMQRMEQGAGCCLPSLERLWQDSVAALSVTPSSIGVTPQSVTPQEPSTKTTKTDEQEMLHTHEHSSWCGSEGVESEEGETHDGNTPPPLAQPLPPSPALPARVQVAAAQGLEQAQVENASEQKEIVQEDRTARIRSATPLQLTRKHSTTPPRTPTSPTTAPQHARKRSATPTERSAPSSASKAQVEIFKSRLYIYSDVI